MYKPSQEERERINHAFIHHPPLTAASARQPERYQAIREWHRKLALNLLEQCPPSRERSLALTKLEESVFWANASIARHEKLKDFPEVEAPAAAQPEPAAGEA